MVPQPSVAREARTFVAPTLAACVLVWMAACIELPEWDPFGPATGAPDAASGADPGGGAEAATLASRTSGAPPLSVRFDALGAAGSTLLTGDPSDLWRLSYHWDFGDGAAARGMLATHVFEGDDGGSFTVTLTIRDGQGQSEAFTETISLEPIPASETICLRNPGQEAPPASLCVDFEAQEDLNLALASVGPGRRQVLLQRGASFTAEGGHRLDLQGFRMGAYGEGPRPRIYLASATGFEVLADDVAIWGIRFDGDHAIAGCGDLGECAFLRAQGGVSHLLAYRIDAVGFDAGLVLGAGQSTRYASFVDVSLENPANGALSLFALSGEGATLADVRTSAGLRAGAIVDCAAGCEGLLVSGGVMTQGVLDAPGGGELLAVGGPTSRVLWQGTEVRVHGGSAALDVPSEVSGLLLERAFFAAVDGVPHEMESYVSCEGAGHLAVKNSLFDLTAAQPEGAAVELGACADAIALHNTCAATVVKDGGTAYCVSGDAGEALGNLGLGTSFRGGATTQGNLVWPVANAAGGFGSAQGYKLRAADAAATLVEAIGALFVDYEGACRQGDQARYGAWESVEGQQGDLSCR